MQEPSEIVRVVNRALYNPLPPTHFNLSQPRISHLCKFVHLDAKLAIKPLQKDKVFKYRAIVSVSPPPPNSKSNPPTFLIDGCQSSMSLTLPISSHQALSPYLAHLVKASWTLGFRQCFRINLQRIATRGRSENGVKKRNSTYFTRHVRFSIRTCDKYISYKQLVSGISPSEMNL